MDFRDDDIDALFGSPPQASSPAVTQVDLSERRKLPPSYEEAVPSNTLRSVPYPISGHPSGAVVAPSLPPGEAVGGEGVGVFATPRRQLPGPAGVTPGVGTGTPTGGSLEGGGAALVGSVTAFFSSVSLLPSSSSLRVLHLLLLFTPLSRCRGCWHVKCWSCHTH
jgi:hypothetical protein